MITRYRVLAERIGQEMRLLGEVVQRCESAMERARQNEADREFYIAATALYLHDFYNGLERLFEVIASEIDGTVPSGSAWHRELLTQMALPLADIRPAVLTREMVQRLDEYLRFRHIVRSVYALHLDAERVKVLSDHLRPVYEQARAELEAFVRFLERLTRADEEE